jgi:hypothetical protein
VGKLIDITPYLAERRLTGGAAPRWRVEVEAEIDLVRDVLQEMEAARNAGLCDTCGRRRAVAEIFRSDAVAAGLGGMYQCHTCLRGELQHNRPAHAARRAEWLLTQILGDRDTVVRLELEWDPHRECAVALDGVRLE